MKNSILSKYHVNEVPLILKPMVFLYGYGIAFVGVVYCLVVHLTCNVVVIGKERLEQRPNHIFCFWHTFIWLYFAVFLRNRLHAWMQHPTWFLKPSHVMLRFIGVRKIVFGSTGHSGKKAADRLVEYLKKGYSTVILPDDPSGPPFIMKKGALHISLQSNVPIAPMRFQTSKPVEIRYWDRRRWPMPFSRITVEIGEPIQVTKENFVVAYDLVSRALG